MATQALRTYVFAVEILDINNCHASFVPKTYDGDNRIHIYENTAVEKALEDLQTEIGGGYKITSMYSEPFTTPTNEQQSNPISTIS